jgi:adsorption protein B
VWWVDVVATYLFGLKVIALTVAIVILVSSLDDLVIDIVYWSRRVWRAWTVYRVHPRLEPAALLEPVEQPLAIMVPAWREAGVIGPMANLAATTLDYENYHLFVGTYPNDMDTQRDVDAVAARFRNVHKVVCARPGPTSKADCLNNVVDAILQFESRANLRFAGFILHDAEDVISSLELRLFNYLVGRKDLIQLPVYPFERRWFDITSAHYMDEFAELHGKDILVREAMAGQVPSAGVGTCFSRRAITSLLASGDGIAFDVQSLTEDYDIGVRLRMKGMTEIFVRFPALGVEVPDVARPRGLGRSARSPGTPWWRSSAAASVVCVREYFPNTVAAAVRQKSRWIIGIVYQGFKTLRWTNDLAVNYFLWRDRKSGINNFASFAATLLLMQLVVLWTYQQAVDDSYQFLSVFEGDLLAVVLGANLVLMANRLAQRVTFVSSFYGVRQGLLSVPRLFWGHWINFLANCRAIRQIVRHKELNRVAWDKTMHDFPSLGEPSRARRPLGHILVARGLLGEEALHDAVTHRIRGLRLGSSMIRQELISREQLAAALADQGGVSWEPLDSLLLRPAVITLMPADVARRYAVLPLRLEGKHLVLASESYIDPVALAALSRRLGYPVSYVIVPVGQVTIGLRYWYPRQPMPENPKLPLWEAVSAGEVAASESDALWQRYVSRQVLFAEILMSLGHLDPAALTSVLLRYDPGATSLGQFLVDERIIDAATLREALELQEQLQGDLRSLLREDWRERANGPGEAA